MPCHLPQLSEWEVISMNLKLPLSGEVDLPLHLPSFSPHSRNL